MLNYQSSVRIQRKFDKKETNDQKVIESGRNSIGACQNYRVNYNMRNFGQRNKVQSSNYYNG